MKTGLYVHKVFRISTSLQTHKHILSLSISVILHTCGVVTDSILQIHKVHVLSVHTHTHTHRQSCMLLSYVSYSAEMTSEGSAAYWSWTVSRNVLMRNCFASVTLFSFCLFHEILGCLAGSCLCFVTGSLDGFLLLTRRRFVSRAHQWSTVGVTVLRLRPAPNVRCSPWTSTKVIF